MAMLPHSGTARRTDDFTGRLLLQLARGTTRPGALLPPPGELADELAVDASCVRTAFSQLRLMNVLSDVTGEGAVVNDVRETAGIDFLSALFSIDAAPNDSTLLLQMLDFQTALLPGLLELAARRATPDELRAHEALYEQILQDPEDIEGAARLAIEAQDLVARVSMNGIVRAVFNATRPIRLRLMQLVLETVDVRLHFETQLGMLRDFARGDATPDELAARYVDFQDRFSSNAYTWLGARVLNAPHAPMHNGADA